MAKIKATLLKKVIILIPIISILSSCAQDKRQDSRKNNSELLIRIDAVHKQIMRQGNISEAEKEAILSLAAIIPPARITDPLGSFNDNLMHSFQEVEKIPIYQGCENLTNEEKKKCFISNITEFIDSEFDIQVAEKLGLTGNQQIDVFIRIDKYGYPSALKVRDTFVELQAEAVRVLNKIPRMKPASQNGENVATVYPDDEIPHTIVLEIK